MSERHCLICGFGSDADDHFARPPATRYTFDVCKRCEQANPEGVWELGELAWNVRQDAGASSVGGSSAASTTARPRDWNEIRRLAAQCRPSDSFPLCAGMVVELINAHYDELSEGAGRARRNASEQTDASSPGAPVPAVIDRLTRISDVLEAWAGGHFNYYPKREREPEPAGAALIDHAEPEKVNEWPLANSGPASSPIPRQAVLASLIESLRRMPPKDWGLDTGARAAYLFLMQPGAPCGHARAFFYENEQGQTGCMACDMWDDCFAK